MNANLWPERGYAQVASKHEINQNHIPVHGAQPFASCINMCMIFLTLRDDGRCSLARKIAELVVNCHSGDSNVHLQATAVLVGVKLRDLGGKLITGKPYGRDPGAKFGHFVGDVEAKSGHGREAICQMLFSHIVGFMSQSARSQKHQNFYRGMASYGGKVRGS